MSPADRNRLAVIAFLFHAPGLRLLTAFRFSGALVKLNIAALSSSAIITFVATWYAPDRLRILTGLFSWSICHFIWGTFLAVHVFRNSAQIAAKVRD